MQLNQQLIAPGAFFKWCRELDCRVQVWYTDPIMGQIIFDAIKLIAFR